MAHAALRRFREPRQIPLVHARMATGAFQLQRRVLLVAEIGGEQG
jgi:hypothetical protein